MTSRRYLEAFLDGRLGRSRSATLRRHLGMCAGCRARVERLRQFERDMQRRFRSMRQEGSIWRGLGVDLVAAARANPGHLLALPRLLPVPTAEASFGRQTAGPRGALSIRSGRSNGMGRGSPARHPADRHGRRRGLSARPRFAIAGTEPPDPAAQVYQELAQGEPALALRSQDAHQLEGWLSHELGMPVTLPPRLRASVRWVPTAWRSAAAPAGRCSTGARPPSAPAPVPPPRWCCWWSPATRPPARHGQANPGQGGLHEISWQRAALQFTVISDRPVEAMRRFVD
ncbi:MAG: zf-HC2 domain-containing protein [Geminicoccaceae bacterium]